MNEMRMVFIEKLNSCMHFSNIFLLRIASSIVFKSKIVEGRLGGLVKRPNFSSGHDVS